MRQTPSTPRPFPADPLDLLSRPGPLPQAAALKALEPFRDRTGREIFIDDAVAAGLSNELLAVGVSERAIFDATNRLLTGPTPIRRRADTTAFGLQRPRPAADTTAFGLQRPPPQPFIGPPEPSRSRIPVAQITPLDREGAPIAVTAGDRVPRARVRGAVDRAEARRLAILQSMAGPAGVLGLTSELYRREAIASVNASEVLGEITPEQSETLRQEINRLAAKIPGETIKEVGRSLIPVEGTRHTWAASPGWARGLNVAADIAFFIPIIGQMSALTRAGVRARSIASQIAIAEIMSPIQAARHPIRTIQFALEPIETAIRPGKVPINAVEVRTATIRIPVAEGAVLGALDIAVPQNALVRGKGLSRGTTKLADISNDNLRAEIATTLEARDRLTRAAIAGDRPAAQFPAGEIEALSPALQRNIGEAAIHSSPDLRPFLVGAQAGGAEGGLFVGPSVMSRFIRNSATGKAVDLPAEVQEAIAIGKIPDKPVPGSLLIRDPDIIAQLQGSNKLWQGTAEIELIIPSGTTLPAPSQLLFTRLSDGSRSTLAVIGVPLSPAEVARLKIVGSVDTVKNIFSKPGVFRPGTSATPPTNRAIAHGQKTEQAIIRADELTRNGQIIDAAGEQQRAAREARLAIDEMRRASDRSFTRLAGRTRPAVLYTGRQDVSRALEEVDAAGRRVFGRARDTAPPTVRTFAVDPRAATVPASRLDQIIQEAARARATEPQRRPGARVVARAAPIRLPAHSRLTTPELLRIIGLPEASRAPGPVDPHRTTISARAALPPTGRITPPPTGLAPPPTERVATPPADRVITPTGRVTPPPPSRVPLPPPTPDRGRGDGGELPGRGRGRFILPSGVLLPIGIFPEIVEWPQGEVKIRGNLITGNVTFEDRVPDGTTPAGGFKVLQIGRTPPPARLLELGFEDVSISPTGIFFVGRPKRGRRSESRQLVRRTAIRR